MRGINGQSSGMVPFIHMFDGLIKAVNQGGRRRGTQCIYIEPWHLEISGFLDLREEAPATRTCGAHSLNTALWIPDEFFRRWRPAESGIWSTPNTRRS